MTDTTITALNPGTVESGDLLAMDKADGSETQKVTAQAIADLSALILGSTPGTAYAGNDGQVNADNIAAILARVHGLDAGINPPTMGTTVPITYEFSAASIPQSIAAKVLPSVEMVKALIGSYAVTVSQAVAGAEPTKAECLTAFKTLPHHDFSLDDHFYLMDTTGQDAKLYDVRYLANGNTTEQGTNYAFWVEALTKAA